MKVKENLYNPIISKSFHDVDQLVESVCWQWRETHIDQLSLNPFQVDMIRLNFQDFVFFRFNLISPLHHWGDRPQDYIMFLILLEPLQNKSALIQNCEVNENTLWGFDATKESNSIFPSHTSLAVIHIRKKFFQDYCQIMGRDDLLSSRFLKNDCISLPLTLSNYRNYVKQLIHLMEERSPLLYRSDFRWLIIEDLLPLLIDTIPRMKSSAKENLLPKKKIKPALKAREYILNNLQQPLTLKKLHQAIDSSRRNLYYSFEATFGMTPMHYVKGMRLHGLRRELKAAEPEKTMVMNIASRWGFWSAGHLARDYKKMFGELPSETLSKNWQ